ncbi:hypothetical protein NDU88_004691 [Pleurodeles waltl]|uniref:Uncharacterized protein n=1 Tax=Pleurodeles waltl TaxID=8319 RepID=A0AAV7PKJ4_PLEWA|nr:hypothetical protein NDU88_004691 [Pleurodeles waltl]
MGEEQAPSIFLFYKCFPLLSTFYLLCCVFPHCVVPVPPVTCGIRRPAVMPVSTAPPGASWRSIEAGARARPAKRAAREEGAAPAEDPRGQLRDPGPEAT